MDLVSVIIPCYNVSSFVDKLSWIFEQTYPELEFVLVEDCSTDDTWQKLQDFKSLHADKRIILERNEQNLGAGETRNRGFALSSGKYVCFWDADDRALPLFVEKMLAKIQQEQADFVYCANTFLYDDVDNQFGQGGRVEKFHEIPKELLAVQHDINELKRLVFRFSYVVWNKLVRRDYIQEHDIRFPPFYGEDLCWNMQLVLNAQRIALIEESYFQHYVDNPASFTHRMNAQNLRAESFWNVEQFYFDYMNKLGVTSALFDEWTRDFLGEASHVLRIIPESERRKFSLDVAAFSKQHQMGITVNLPDEEQSQDKAIASLSEDEFAHEFIKTALRLKPKLLDEQGKTVSAGNERFGAYILENFTTVNILWADDFNRYIDAHAMGPVVAKLKEGMDGVSCDYVDRFTALRNAARVSDSCLFGWDLILSPIDKFLLGRNRKMVAAGHPEFLRHVSLEWSSGYTNQYGLYDVPDAVIEAVNGNAVFDVGSFIGDTLVLFRALFPKSQLLSFEPDKRNYQQLVRMMHGEIESGTTLAFNQGLADKRGKMTLQQQNVGNMSTFLKGEKGTSVTLVDVSTIDDIVKEHQLEVGLIKVNVDGFEQQVVQGALETIKSQRPVLVIAIYHQPEEFYELKPFLESLNLGYKFRVRRSCFFNLTCELVLIAYVED